MKKDKPPKPGEIPMPEKKPETIPAPEPNPGIWPKKEPEILPEREPLTTPPLAPPEIPKPPDFNTKAKVLSSQNEALSKENFTEIHF